MWIVMVQQQGFICNNSITSVNSGDTNITYEGGGTVPPRARDFDFGLETPEEETPKTQDWDDEEEEYL